MNILFLAGISSLIFAFLSAICGAKENTVQAHILFAVACFIGAATGKYLGLK